MLTKISLLLAGLASLVYGLTCFFAPSVPAELAGFEIITGDARIEIASFFGGLQIGLGLFLLMGLFKQEYTKPGLVLILFTIGFLVASRIILLILNPGEAGSYTHLAIAVETTFVLFAAAALAKTRIN